MDGSICSNGGASCVVGVEMFKKTLDYGGAGDNVGCLLRTVKREDVQRGQVGRGMMRSFA